MSKETKHYSVAGFSLPGLGDPSIPIAASRAGAIGILDLQYVEESDAETALEELVRYGRGNLGMRIDALAGRFLETLAPVLLERLDVIVLSLEAGTDVDSLISTLRLRKCRVFLEVTRVEQLHDAERLGCDAIIAKGQESGGYVGYETAFVLYQRLAGATERPIWVQGGIGPNTAAACFAAGAGGVVLDSQLLLCRESQIPAKLKKRLSVADGSETALIGAELGDPCRVFPIGGKQAANYLRSVANELGETDKPWELSREKWWDAVRSRYGVDHADGGVLFIGQDVSFAAPFADEFVTVGGVIQAVKRQVGSNIKLAEQQRSLQPDSPLAQTHHTEFPIVQGPMTRVSDSPDFAASVADAGGLPFMALALLKGSEVENLLAKTGPRLGKRSWGVGILGFVDEQLRREQMQVVLKHKPPFALIAGGRPDQAAELEHEGIPTYLHVASPSLLRMFWREGARRFVLEGRECGGHVGPRTSFVLWELMARELTTLLGAEGAAEECAVLFAGGISDDLSAVMIASLAAPLVQRGARVGVLLGTAYLFSDEAVATGAIVQNFQDEAIKCGETAELESGPGHANRCAVSPFVDMFRAEAKRFEREGVSADERRKRLDELTLGRLRIASKGITRNPAYDREPRAPRFSDVPPPRQHREGMYMIGQLAALRDGTCSMRELHEQISVGGGRRLEALSREGKDDTPSAGPQKPVDVAIVGMSCFLPGAEDIAEYWWNIVNKVDSVDEIPADRWDWRHYFDAEPDARDKIYSKWGGFLKEVPFDPVEYGIPPSTLTSVEPAQLLTLVAVKQALEDAGYWTRDFERETTSVILGVSGGAGDLGQRYAFRSELPRQISGVEPADLPGLPEWTGDSFPGILLNVYAGRVSNRFDFGGANFTVDAACASSLASVYLGIRELVSGTSDMVITGGVDTLQNPFAYLCFSKTKALSPSGRCSTFDADADGIAISEGLAMLVLKRLEDAERDGDRIYAVLKGMGTSSDGRDRTLTVPRPIGQRRALERAYAAAGFSPATVGLFEAHGTGTIVGDRAEIESLAGLLTDVGAAPRSCALGSVKSMIGHTKSAAGAAGLIKAALALHHRTLPPTLHVDRPSDALAGPEQPLYVNSEPRPWMTLGHHPRRSGVSAFGFGGTNFHAVLEEYNDEFVAERAAPLNRKLPIELFYWAADSRDELRDGIASLQSILDQGVELNLGELAATVWSQTRKRQANGHRGEVRVAVLAQGLDDLKEKLTVLLTEWTGDDHSIFVAEGEPEGALAFLFPGQGSQYPDMLRDLSLFFPEVRKPFETADRVLADAYAEPLSSYVYPPPRFTAEDESQAARALTVTNVTQPALGAAETALLALLRALDISPAMCAGHSYGEFVALHSAGVFDEETLFRLSEVRGRMIIERMRADTNGAMVAVSASREELSEYLETGGELYLANLNSPRQTVLSGSEHAVATVIDKLEKKDIWTTKLRVSCAFHSPLVEQARAPFAEFLSGLEYRSPRYDVYSNATATLYPDQAKEIFAILAEHLVQPVDFVNEIESMYTAGARIFVEVGPRDVLTNLTRQILEGRPHVALPLNRQDEDGYIQLVRTVGELAVRGVKVNLGRLFEGRIEKNLDPANLEGASQADEPSKTRWMVSAEGVRAPNESFNRRKPVNVSSKQTRVSDSAALPQSAAFSQSRSAAERLTVAQQEAAGGEAPAAHRSAVPADGLQALGGNELSHIVTQHQRLMGRFLEVQQQIMQAYLGAPVTGEMQTHPDILTALQRTEPPSGVAAPPLPEKEPEPQAVHPPEAEPASAVKPAPRLERNAVERRLLDVVAERTGYPLEMLGLEMDIEADLGIDSIKRVEILGEYRRAFGPEVEQLLKGAMDRLTGAKSLGRIVELSMDLLGASAGAGEAEPAPAATPAPGLERDVVERRLLDVVAERTGYPLEMLGLEMDIEADLGIDSIKRVEILGEYRRAFGPEVEQLLKGAMDRLTGAKSLGRIVELSLGAIEQPQGVVEIQANDHTTGAAAPSEIPHRREVAQEVPRYLLRVASLSRLQTNQIDLKGRSIIVTDDGRGVAASLAGKIRSLGGTAIVVGVVDRKEGDPELRVDLSDQEAVLKLIDEIRSRHGALAGIVHLLPLRSAPYFEEFDLQQWQATLAEQIKGLFYLTKAVAKEIREANGWVLAATPMGGGFGMESSVQSVFPGHGGIAGFVKTLAKEWTEVHCTAVDLNMEESPDTLCKYLLEEMSADDSVREVGYRDGERRALELLPTPLPEGAPELISLNRDHVILVIGGARGITAEIALELAERYQPTLLLAGRSPLPPDKEEADTDGLASPQELKATFYRRLTGASDKKVEPWQVEDAYRHLLADREIRANIRAIREAGARVHYFQIDARDSAAMGDLTSRLYQEFGRLDGVILAAGVIEDKLVEDKRPDSFDRVFDTKTDSAFLLSRLLRPESLQFMVFFTSVAGRFGNRGQADYAAANEVLARLAYHLDRRWPGRVVAIDWGPWERGMASSQVQDQLRAQGIQIITLAAGRYLLDRDLVYGEGSEVIWGRVPEQW